MENWRRTLSEAAVLNLVRVNTTIEAVEAIDVAQEHFAMAAEAYGRFRLGLPNPPLDGDALPIIFDDLIRIGKAMVSTIRLSTSHAGSGHVFSIGAAAMGFENNAPWWWQRWEGHHADAAARADMALQRLESAWSHGGAARDAIKVISVPSPVRHAWGPAAEQLLRRTADDLAMARAALEQMRPAVVAEFSDAWMLLSR
jgi:hypothetical protein